VVLAVAALAASSAGAAQAQTAAGSSVQKPQPTRQQGPATLEGFELTVAQKTKIDSIGVKHSAEMKAVGELFATDPGEAMKRMVVLRTTMQKEVRVVLTADQRAIFDRNVTEMNAQMNALVPTAPR
jgi:hypothetical protein